MAAQLFLVFIAALASFQTTWSWSTRRPDPSRPEGCNVPDNLAPMTLREMVGVWYVQASANGSNPSPNRCNKLEYYVRDNGRRGVVAETVLNSTGFYESNLYFVNYYRPGVVSFSYTRDWSLTVWDYVLQNNNDSFLVTACFVRNGTTFQQTYGFISRERNVPQQTVVNAFNSIGMPIGPQNFLSQTNCLN